MQTSINLWLWAYKSARNRYAGYHLRADVEACRAVIAHMAEPGFRKVSFLLRAVPDRMPQILAPADIGFRDFGRLRVQAADDMENPIQIEESAPNLDLRLNAEGRRTFCADMTEMSNGRWDYSGVGGIWYWGLISEAQYRKLYG